MLTLLLRPDLEEKDRLALLDSVKKQLGSVAKEDLWGNRSLTYPIKRQEKAFFAHFEFSLDPEKLSSLDKLIKLDEDILRYLIVRKD